MSDNPFGAGFVPNQMLQLLQQMQASGGELGAALGGGPPQQQTLPRRLRLRILRSLNLRRRPHPRF